MTEISSICLFCGSKTGNDPAYRKAAERLGGAVAERGMRLVYGGGGIGLMGVAVEAALTAGGEVIGVIPEFLMRYEVGKPGISELIVVNSMHERKRVMFEKSDAFVILPGGLGTLDEAIEVITWKQLQLHAKPVVLIDAGGYWKPLKDLVAHVVLAGFAHPAVAELFTIVNSVDEVFDAIASAPEPRIEVLTDHL
ncbi:MAG: Rossman fold protein, TIGR00730 family [Rhodospirillales bacterium RIFCSPLOWO2_12_FULL_58_28]|nr:MAG: Rossman fold protein, TIGR00730 family [Rhodospirillales bacterium RIFCSPLOWO2_02_FULL_58_16]OHC78649.1 MAG: Rossman fold protein, TIGR00730 family [Rhodospirillales bacterium RIFCSPLOWO2_12_FULL_58_28]